MKHNELKKGKIVCLNQDPYEIIKYSHVVKGRGKSVVQTQIRNMRTGNILQKNFHPGDEIEEAELEKINAIFVYSHRGKYVFYKENNPSERFTLDEIQIGEKKDYLKEKTPITVIYFKTNIIGIELPVKSVFRVTQAPPGVKGNRAEGGTKTVTIETGKKITTPLFIEIGDFIEVNTQNGEYVRRVANY
jgi:elongation factor P